MLLPVLAMCLTLLLAVLGATYHMATRLARIEGTIEAIAAKLGVFEAVRAEQYQHHATRIATLEGIAVRQRRGQ